MNIISEKKGRVNVLLQGNQAIARGALESGVLFCASYPGNPSSEILESLAEASKELPIYVEWSVNEKVALEVGIGSSLSGARTLITMKHVGLNVAADPLFTLAYSSINGGLVIVVCDDPGMYSSQNEQDSRHYSVGSKIPMLEPSNSNEAKFFSKIAFDLSEKFKIPFIIRSTMRISHTKTIEKLKRKKKLNQKFIERIQKTMF